MKTTYHQLKNEAVTLSSQIRNIAQQLGHKDLSRLDEGAKILETGKLYVVVCGEFNRGKSSLINALLEVPDLCPVNIDVATSVVIFIEWQADEEILVISGDLDHEKHTQIKREQIKDYVTEQHNKNNHKRVRQLIVKGPFPQLKDGLVIIDTPGLGGLNSEHGAMTYDVLPKSHVALFVMHVAQPLTQRELSFVKEWLARYCKRTLYVVTGIDQTTAYPNYVADAKNKLAATLEIDQEKLTVLPVSNKLKLDYLQTQDPDDLDESRYQDLEAAVWARLNAEAASILVAHALDAISWTLATLREPLEAQEMYLDQQHRDEILQREIKIKESRDRLNQLQDDSIDWVSDAQTGFQDLHVVINSRLNQAFLDIQFNVSSLIQDNKSFELIRDTLSAQTTHTGHDLDGLLDNKTAELYLTLRSQVSVDITEIFPAPIKISTPTVPSPMPATSGNIIQSGVNSIQRGANLVVAGTKKWLSSITGGFLFPIGQTMREFERAHAHFHNRPTQTELTQYLHHFQGIARDSIQTALTQKQFKTRDSIIRQLRTSIRQERDRCNTILAELQSAKTITDIQAKQKKLEQIRAQLKQIAVLETAAATLGEKLETQRLDALAQSQPSPSATDSNDYGDFADA